jgi:hypothetical protein
MRQKKKEWRIDFYKKMQIIIIKKSSPTVDSSKITKRDMRVRVIEYRYMVSWLYFES